MRRQDTNKANESAKITRDIQKRSTVKKRMRGQEKATQSSTIIINTHKKTETEYAKDNIKKIPAHS